MLILLVWVPVGTSLTLGVIYLFFADARPGIKILGIAVFLVAIYLQFFSAYSTLGLLLQIALALYLALWRKIDAI